MKRSKMIEIIRESLRYRITGHTVCPEFIADQVLNDIEEAGMYPPDTVQEGHDVTMWDAE